jgi:hypothetical protein
MPRGRTLAAVVGGLVLVLAAVTSRGDEPSPLPQGARLLFNGRDLSGWVQRDGKPAAWRVENGYVEVVPGKGDIMTKEMFGPAFQLHVEFWIPLMADKKGQDHGNSGVYLQGRYEIQILDSYQNDTYPTGACGALYGRIAPSKNASKPPEQWQTYDITFQAPLVDAKGYLTGDGHVTVVHNGVTVIDHGAFGRETGAAQEERIATPGPIRLQDHGARVRFRNLWLKPLPVGK